MQIPLQAFKENSQYIHKENTGFSQTCFMIDPEIKERSALNMTKAELRQTMMICIVTLEKLNGRIPTPDELYSALGTEYEGLLMEFLSGNAKAAA